MRALFVVGIDLLHSLFADDPDMFLKASGTCLDEVIKELRNFGKVSGCKNNLGKTKCIPLGNAKLNEPLLASIENKYGKEFIISEFTALGVNFDNSRNMQEISDLNYTNKLDKAGSRAKFWKTRDLTIFGRITLIKSLLLAQFVYISTSMLRPSNVVMKDITKFIFNFLCGINRDKFRRDIVTQKREMGGLNMY